MAQTIKELKEYGLFGTHTAEIQDLSVNEIYKVLIDEITDKFGKKHIIIDNEDVGRYKVFEPDHGDNLSKEDLPVTYDKKVELLNNGLGKSLDKNSKYNLQIDHIKNDTDCYIYIEKIANKNE